MNKSFLEDETKVDKKSEPIQREALKVTNAKVEHSENETAGAARKGEQKYHRRWR